MPPSPPEPFPTHLPLFDAHCHPTDTMSLIPQLPSMRARALTVMATRQEDQHLVREVAERYGIRSKEVESWGEEERVVPCWGWHPWFACGVWDDNGDGGDGDGKGEGKGEGLGKAEEGKKLEGEDKIRHYASVLLPPSKSINDPTNEDRDIFETLPDPQPLSQILSHLRTTLSLHPLSLVGEIGLDRSFRIPHPWTPSQLEERTSNLTLGGREGRRLTPYRCNMEHQKKVFKAQLRVAGEMGRAVSVHGVQAHGVVFECLREGWKGWERGVVSKREKKKKEKGGEGGGSEGAGEAAGGGADLQAKEVDEGATKPKPFPPRVCLHSFSGGPDVWRQYLHPSIPVEFFVSFSTAINLGDMSEGEEEPEAFVKMVRAVPDEMVLVESDLHTAGEEMDRRLEDVVRRVCRIKGWGLEEGVERLGANWKRFVFGEG